MRTSSLSSACCTTLKARCTAELLRAILQRAAIDIAEADTNCDRKPMAQRLVRQGLLNAFIGAEQVVANELLSHSSNPCDGARNCATCERTLPA